MPAMFRPPRSLRRQVLILFTGVAVLPLVALGAMDYAHARRVVDQVLVVQNDTAAARAAQMIAERFAIVQSDALLLENNDETQRLYTAGLSGDSSLIRARRAGLDSLATSLWRESGYAYDAIELRDSRGRPLYRLAAPADPDGAGPAGQSIVDTVHRGASTQPMGELLLATRPGTLLPPALQRLAFGVSGELLVVDRPTRAVVFDSRHIGTRAVADSSLAAVLDYSRPSGPIEFTRHDSARVGSLAQLASPPWTVVASTATNEFANGLAASRARDLALVLATAIGMAVLFALLIGRAMRDLEALTAAAHSVTAGNLTPALPPAGSHEVGTLSASFGSMLERLREMMREIEVSRQLAVVGQFSAQLAHEIRNPLTSIKLNMQAIAREVQRGKVPASAEQSLSIALREVKRLDGVVRGALQLSRPRPLVRQPLHLNALLDDVLALLSEQMRDCGVGVSRHLHATDDVVCGDREQLSGVFLNLLLNAIEAQCGTAQSRGGHILVLTTLHDADEHAPAPYVRVIVADDGPGIPEPIRERLFHPFASGKPNGTGLGLATALRTVAEHGGRLELIAPVNGYAGYSGAAFAVELPARRAEVP